MYEQLSLDEEYQVISDLAYAPSYSSVCEVCDDHGYTVVADSEWVYGTADGDDDYGYTYRCHNHPVNDPSYVERPLS